MTIFDRFLSLDPLLQVFAVVFVMFCLLTLAANASENRRQARKRAILERLGAE